MSDNEEAFESADEDVDNSNIQIKTKIYTGCESGKREQRQTNCSPHCEKPLTGITDDISNDANVHSELGLSLTHQDELNELGGESVKTVKTAVEETVPPSEVGELHSPASQTIQSSQQQAVTTQPNNEQPQAQHTNETKPSYGWGTWSNWGSTFMSVASSSVSTFTSHVEDGWNTVIETVESTLGAPSAEELAEQEKAEKGRSGEVVTKEGTDVRGEAEASAGSDIWTEGTEGVDGVKDTTHGGFWSSLGIQELEEITSLVTNKGKKLVTGGLDVLETIGKKTYDVVTQNDPMLQKARDRLSHRGNRPNLSALLREAKESANERAEIDREEDESVKCNFSFIFDEYQGLSHLEALEILSGQSEGKVQHILFTCGGEGQERVVEGVKDEFVWEDESDDEDGDTDDEKDHDFCTLVTTDVSKLQLSISPGKLTDVQRDIRVRLNALRLKEPYGDEHASQSKDVHNLAIRSLAELTAKSMDFFHKTAELILLQTGDCPQVAHQANTLARLTHVLCAEVGILSSGFTKCLSHIAAESTDSDLIHPLMTIVYLEASNSSTYIHDAFQLLLPVLQQVALDRYSAVEHT